MSMFDNYPQPKDYIPNNRPKCHKPFKLDIMVGETAIQSFDIPFNVEEVCTDWKIIYKMGVDVVLIKEKQDIDVVTEDDGTSILTCTLTPTETTLFSSTILDTHVQIKFIMKTNEIVYSEIYKVNVRDSLDKGSNLL